MRNSATIRRWSGILKLTVTVSVALVVSCTPTAAPLPEVPLVELGSPVQVAAATIGTEGGTLAADDSEGPLLGLTIDVPANAYTEPTDFAVSYRSVLSHRIESFTPRSPLIEIAGTGGYAGAFVQVTVPVQVPDGHFAMAFLYDEQTERFEGLPIVQQNNEAVVLATRHFSEILVGSVPLSQLQNLDVDTGYVPGRDDWRFPNWGSFITRYGNCVGMTLSSLWYYLEKRPEGEPVLWGRYDNDLEEQKRTPYFYPDDHTGVHVVSIIQKHIGLEVNQEIYNAVLSAKLEGPHRNFNAIAFALKTTGEPQILALHREGSNIGHAVACYAITGRTLHVADPNFPGDVSRTITFDGQRFLPYASGERADESHTYDNVLYYGKTGVYKWDEIGRRWLDVEAGDSQDEFPWYDYTISVRDEQGGTIETFGLDLLNDNVVGGPTISVEVEGRGDRILRVVRYEDLNWDAHADATDPTFGGARVTLKPGDNLLGFYLSGDVWDWRLGWAAFDWVNIVYDSEPVDEPDDSPLSMLNTCQIAASFGAHYEEAAIYDFQQPGPVRYDSGFMHTWTAEKGGFSGTTFTGSYSRTGDDRLPWETFDTQGTITVELDPETLDVVHFSASETLVSPESGETRRATLSGTAVPMYYLAESPAEEPYLQCLIEGAESCSSVSSVSYRIEREESEWFAEAAWTEITGIYCTGATMYGPSMSITFTKDQVSAPDPW